MTKKDYELIAEAIRVVIATHPSCDDLTAERIVMTLSQKLRATNPAFDAKRFVAACYPNTYTGRKD